MRIAGAHSVITILSRASRVLSHDILPSGVSNTTPPQLRSSNAGQANDCKHLAKKRGVAEPASNNGEKGHAVIIASSWPHQDGTLVSEEGGGGR